MQITIGGMPGSGKTIIGKFLSKKLNLKFYSIGDIKRKLAKKRGLTILEFNRLNEDTDTEVDNYQKELGEKEEDIIVDGRLAFYFLPNSKKIFLYATPEEAAKRIFKDQRPSESKYESEKQIIKDIKIRINNDKSRYLKYYNVDPYKKSNFDLYLDTTNLTIDKVKQKILNFLSD